MAKSVQKMTFNVDSLKIDTNGYNCLTYAAKIGRTVRVKRSRVQMCRALSHVLISSTRIWWKLLSTPVFS